ncbi:hypothetical protein CYMTET_18998 [Cymbomonas tetramitiformis]|uniref:ER-bound oxygenase mpaB/mpaB'/Rubber oxygenase catalytic domain-containing protein n=1 Tax=Cymbomonas tetramitiformis TaxID=36881 RepID=A0AAE0G6W6_9CHLO|nr:hypothetical protein CYMTET_18998 [Cymbomonas tetramitiformis]
MGDSVDVFNVGRFSLSEESRSKEKVTPVATEDKNAVKVGQVVEKYGYQYLWTTMHISVSELETWRTLGDDVADSAVQSDLETRHKSTSEQSQKCRRAEDLLTRLKGKCQRREGNKPDDGYDEAKQFMESLALPDWVDWERVRRGQLFFLKHLVGASTCLLHISLIGGFGAPKINKVLNSTGYLASAPESTFKRLVETIQMISDCMGDGALQKGGVGWNSVARVRLLHAAVRVRLKSQPKWDMHTWGLPINQEDLFVTTLAFSQVVLNGLERIGSTLTTSHEDMEDYLHLWRVIGHLMGVQPALLQRMESLWGAQAALESVVLHLVEPDASTRRLANHLIASMVGRLPTGRSEMEMAGLTRRLMGNHYADAMGIPVVNDPVLLSTIDKRLAGMRAIPQMMTIPFIGNALTIFTKWGLDKWIILNLGGRRSSFGLSYPPSDLQRARSEAESNPPSCIFASVGFSGWKEVVEQERWIGGFPFLE